MAYLKTWDNCYISIVYGRPNILLNAHLKKELNDEMDSFSFEDINWTWEFGDDNLSKDGVYQCEVSITYMDDIYGPTFHIHSLKEILIFDGCHAL